MLLSFKVSHIVTVFAVIYCTGFAVDDSNSSLVVSIVKVLKFGVELDWHLKKTVQLSGWEKLSDCEMVYGSWDSDNLQQVQVMPFIPSNTNPHVNDDIYSHHIELYKLEPLTSYHFHMICYNNQGKKFVSNNLNFTTGIKVATIRKKKKPLGIRRTRPSFSYSQPNNEILEKKDNRGRPGAPSSNVILGAVCGIVGFLIINVTVVMAVRKYSHRQIRRHHMLGLEDREYDGFQYIQYIE